MEVLSSHKTKRNQTRQASIAESTRKGGHEMQEEASFNIAKTRGKKILRVKMLTFYEKVVLSDFFFDSVITAIAVIVLADEIAARMIR